MTVAAVERCLALIEFLAKEPEGMDLGALARAVEMPKSATHRLLATLVERGWVVQDEETLAYAVSLRLAMLAFRNLDARKLPDTAQAVLDTLARETGEYCRMALVEGEDLVWIARAQGATRALRYDPDMGEEVVLHATATGKAWLATLPEEAALRIVCARGFKAKRPLGPNAVADVDALRRSLGETRERGFAVALEEGEPGTVALAVPFRAEAEADAPVVGTLSLAGPLVRMGIERHAALGAALQRAAREVETLWPLRRRQRGAAEVGAGPLLRAG